MSASRKSRRGGAMLELVLISPWIFVLFIGALDWGFYSSALISLESAVRSAVLYTSGNGSTADATGTACTIVLDELRKLPNIGSSVTTCTNPTVTAEKITTGPGSAMASRVTVTYTSISLIPIPGLLRKQFSVTRSAIMRVRSTST
jgi:Flp pilus assembly protein TadG